MVTGLSIRQGKGYRSLVPDVPEYDIILPDSHLVNPDRMERKSGERDYLCYYFKPSVNIGYSAIKLPQV